MTTQYYSTTFTNATQAGFQAWGSAFSAALQACGLSQTADTGQINWSTVALATAVNTAAGYEIYQFTDALQSTYPIFVKVEYGNGVNQPSGNCPGIWITVGTGSNGAGTLTGAVSGRQQITNNYNASGGIASTTSPYPSYFCFDGSYLGVAHKIGSMSWYNGGAWPCGVFMVGRASNSSGTYVGGGYTFMYPNVTSGSPQNETWTCYCMNTATSTAYSSSGGFSMIPFSLTSTSTGSGNYQLFPCFAAFPTVSPLNWCCHGLVSETTQGNTVSTTIVGSTAQTYLMLGTAAMGPATPSSTAYALLMKYQ